MTNTRNCRGTQESARSPEDMQKYTVLLFSGVPEKVDLPSILQLFKGVDILSAEKDSFSVHISFFSYFDLFQQWTALGSEVVLEGTKVAVQPIESPLSDKEREKLYIAHAAGGTRNVMLTSLDDFMTGDFIREEAEKYGAVESLKHMRDRKLAYIEFFSFVAAMEFVVNIREDSLFQNVKTCFGKDKCGTGESDDTAAHNSRTVYFGNIPVDTTPAEILAVVQGGRVYTIKLIRDKKCAFVAFFNYVSAAAFIEYSQMFSVCIRGMQVKLGPGKIQQLPHIAPVLAYKGATRSILLRMEKSINEAKLEPELSRYGEIDKIERKEGDLVTVSYLSVQDSHTAYEALLNDPTISHMLCGYAEDPCAEVSAYGLMMEIQRKEFMV
ncbi:hypothetical protein NEMIN01_0576 [Nematocida minor]|uniref:uncharacterized protein n=1 Tax=Nematocida minor TaxID=1912983 RepID=UPI00221EA9EE|nr:uncharacterized protein NEMIN01_0576 [Nematocida minor]KAI5189623.1 hypothetical protein NEMIN01_0576 [Nematocida minor]